MRTCFFKVKELHKGTQAPAVPRLLKVRRGVLAANDINHTKSLRQGHLRAATPFSKSPANKTSGVQCRRNPAAADSRLGSSCYRMRQEG